MENLLYSDRLETEKSFIKEVCDDILSRPIVDKEKSDLFAGIFVEGRNREIKTLEDLAAIHSFKAFSAFNYPIFCFIHNINNFLLGEPKIWLDRYRIRVIEIPEINSLEEYSKFCIEKLYYLLPPEIENIITLQPDGMLLRSGWEEYVLDSQCDWLSPHWKHWAGIDVLWDDGEFGPVNFNLTCIGNG